MDELSFQRSHKNRFWQTIQQDAGAIYPAVMKEILPYGSTDLHISHNWGEGMSDPPYP